MSAKKLQSFTVNIRITAIVRHNLMAESLEQALDLARKQDRPGIVSGDYQYIDGSEEIVGVDGAWNID